MNNLPEIQFVEKDVETILSDMIAGYEKAYFEQTGQRKKLFPGDPIRIFLYTQALREVQLRHVIDNAAKQNLLAYSRGVMLDHLGVFQDVSRLPATKAVVNVKFSLSAPQTAPVIIPEGTRVSPDDTLYFATLERHEIEAGQTEIIVPTECLQAGEVGNGFTAGQINILVDPLPWVDSVVNVEESKGGANVENDESLRERIRLAPEGFSVAGPTGAYESLAKSYSSLIQDVAVLSPEPGHVDVRVLLNGGELPNEAFLQGMLLHLSDKTKRPFTDYVQTNAPDVVDYDVRLKYYINSDSGTQEAQIQKQVQRAIQEYTLWQKSKIGRDINPSELVARIIRAGAKRVELHEPIYNKLERFQVAIENEVNIDYGGIEDE